MAERVSDGNSGRWNREKVKVAEWVSWERWDFDFMLITSKGRLLNAVCSSAHLLPSFSVSLSC